MKDTKELITVAAGPKGVQERLASDLERVRGRLRTLVEPTQEKINGPIMYSIAHSGRLLRPILLLLASYLVEPDGATTSPAHVIDAAATVEILHVATLYHDDLIDRAPIRRGQPTANAKYGPAIALLTGDYLLASCMRSAAALGAEQTVTMADTLIGMCAGQILESSQLFDPDRTEEDYFTAIAGKTAHLMRTCTTMGALQHAADAQARDALETFGVNLGMAFQIWDDILDFFGADTGKENASDLRNGVYTLPVIYAIKDAPERVLPALRHRPLSPDGLAEVLAAMESTDAIGRAAQAARRYVSDAIFAIASSPSLAGRSTPVSGYLLDMVDRLASQHPAFFPDRP